MPVRPWLYNRGHHHLTFFIDIVERFQLSLMLAVIAIRNMIEMSGSEIAFLPKSFMKGKSLVDSILSVGSLSPHLCTLLNETCFFLACTFRDHVRDGCGLDEACLYIKIQSRSSVCLREIHGCLGQRCPSSWFHYFILLPSTPRRQKQKSSYLARSIALGRAASWLCFNPFSMFGATDLLASHRDADHVALTPGRVGIRRWGGRGAMGYGMVGLEGCQLDRSGYLFVGMVSVSL